VRQSCKSSRVRTFVEIWSIGGHYQDKMVFDYTSAKDRGFNNLDPQSGPCFELFLQCDACGDTPSFVVCIEGGKTTFDWDVPNPPRRTGTGEHQSTAAAAPTAAAWIDPTDNSPRARAERLRAKFALSEKGRQP
jgi:hypothetical protein